MKIPAKHGAAWKTNEKHRLRNCWDRGMTIEQIACEMKRSDNSICLQLIALKICSDKDQVLFENDARHRRGDVDYYTRA